MKSKITSRLSLRAKFKSTSLVEVVIMDDKNNVQIELIPIQLLNAAESVEDVVKAKAAAVQKGEIIDNPDASEEKESTNKEEEVNKDGD